MTLPQSANLLNRDDGPVCHRFSSNQRFPDDFAARFMQGCSPAAIAGKVTSAEAVGVLDRFLAKYHPDALCAFAFGSAVRDTLGPCSDLDLLIIETKPTFWGARRHIFEGFPVEAHVFDRQRFLEGVRAASQSGRINVTFALSNCRTLVDTTGLGAELRRVVDQVISQGPPPMTREVAALAYCTVATSLFELATNPDADERFAVMITLQTIMMNFYFGSRREWANSRKWAVRDAPAFAEQLNAALQRAHRDAEVSALVNILQELAAPWPGLGWQGAHSHERAL